MSPGFANSSKGSAVANDLVMRIVGMNLTAAVAVLAVLALRKLGRAAIGAQAAYTLWLIVPAVMLTSLLPPRTISLSVSAPLVAAPATAIAPSAVFAFMASKATPIRAASAIAAPKVANGPNLNLSQALVGVWLLGIAVSLIMLVAGQRRAVAQFGRIIPDSQNPNMGRASNPKVGPALLGIVRPRVIVPVDFEARFDAKERAMILAHEGTHLAKGHSVINALVALLRAVCWFNPLVHLGARYARLDQELACDAAVVERFPGERQAYAQALLKTQLVFAPLPLGCYWPVRSPSRLEERIEMLARNTPGRLRMRAGVCASAGLTACAGLIAWLSEPPVAKMAPATFQAPVAASIRKPAPALAFARQDPPAEAPAVKVTQNVDPPKEIVLAQTVSAPPPDQSLSTAAPSIEVATALAQPSARAPSTTVSLDKIEAASPKAITAQSRSFVQSYATASNPEIGQISRWHTPICVQVQGLAQAAEANQVKARIESVAQSVGLPAARAGCRANVEIVFSDDAQRTMDDVAIRSEDLLGYYHRSERDRLKTVNRPIQAWYKTSTVGGSSPNLPAGYVRIDDPDTGAPTGCAGAPRFTACLTSQFENVLIVADAKALQGKNLSQVADHLVMLALSQPKSPDGCTALSSILDSPDCTGRSPPNGLTPADAAYLAALYASDPQAKGAGAQSDIANRMAMALIKATSTVRGD